MGVARDLTLITKTLQNLGNLKQFGAKEAYLEPVNSFLQENMENMKVRDQKETIPSF
jgi:Ras GTPase-activating protein 1